MTHLTARVAWGASRLRHLPVGCCLIAIMAGCYAASDYEGNDLPRGRLRLTVSPDSLPADGYGNSMISVETPLSETNPSPTVSLKTSAGVFEESGTSQVSLTVDRTGTATAHLRSTVATGVARLTATLGRLRVEDSVRFVSAPPTGLVLDPAAFALSAKPGTELALRLQLTRTPGRPTAGQQIRLSATGTGGPIGIFGPVLPTDTAGKVTVRFTLNDSSYRALVRIRAAAAGVLDSVRDSVLIQALP